MLAKNWRCILCGASQPVSAIYAYCQQTPVKCPDCGRQWTYTELNNNYYYYCWCKTHGSPLYCKMVP